MAEVANERFTRDYIDTYCPTAEYEWVRDTARAVPADQDLMFEPTAELEDMVRDLREALEASHCEPRVWVAPIHPRHSMSFSFIIDERGYAIAPGTKIMVWTVELLPAPLAEWPTPSPFP